MRVYLVKDEEERKFLGECKNIWDKSFSDVLRETGIKWDYMRIQEFKESYWIDFGSHVEFIEVLY